MLVAPGRPSQHMIVEAQQPKCRANRSQIRGMLILGGSAQSCATSPNSLCRIVPFEREKKTALAFVATSILLSALVILTKDYTIGGKRY